MAKDRPATGARAPGDKQVFRVTIDASIETVWSTLVKTDAVLPFFFGAVCDTERGLSPGAPMRMVTADRRHASVVGKVIEFAPPHRYSHTMGFTAYDEEPATVSYQLKELRPGKTEFTLELTRLPPASPKTGKSMAQGGAFIVANLKALIETGKPAFSGRMVGVVNALTGWMTPKTCRIENWPFGRMTGGRNG
jgi:uncharacterized protein YndB with AHSA1/START domain